jgi:hypothetical protein
MALFRQQLGPPEGVIGGVELRLAYMAKGLTLCYEARHVCTANLQLAVPFGGHRHRWGNISPNLRWPARSSHSHSTAKTVRGRREALLQAARRPRRPPFRPSFNQFQLSDGTCGGVQLS